MTRKRIGKRDLPQEEAYPGNNAPTPLPISGEVLVGREEGLDPAEYLGIIQFEGGSPVGV